MLSLTLALQLDGFASDAFVAGGDDTIGSLPGHGGGGYVPAGFDTRPGLSLETDTVAQGSQAILEIDGTGDVTVLELPSGRIRFMFRGDLEVTFDELGLTAPGMKLGVTAASLGTPVLAQFVLPSLSMTPDLLTPGETLELPVQRMLDANLLDSGALVRTFHGKHLDSQFQLSSQGGVFTAVITD